MLRSLILSEGTYENSVFNMPVKQKVTRSAEQVYLVVDKSKLGKPALNKVLNTEDIDVLITEGPLNVQELDALKSKNIQIHLTS